jgi:nitrate/TMAO reductase-like tetraheme cytochrome c subunit
VLTKLALVGVVVVVAGCGSTRAAAPRPTPTPAQAKAPSCDQLAEQVLAQYHRRHPKVKMTGVRSTCAQLHVRR